MTADARFLDALREVLAFVPDLRLKTMFGAVGVYSGEVFFAVGEDDALYLKVDAETEPAFRAEGLKPFVFRDSKGVETTLSYWRAPDEVWEDPDVARHWVDLAIGAARRKKARKR